MPVPLHDFGGKALPREKVEQPRHRLPHQLRSSLWGSTTTLLDFVNGALEVPSRLRGTSLKRKPDFEAQAGLDRG